MTSNTTRRYVGEQITATDAAGTTGPATVTAVHSSGHFRVRPDFPYRLDDETEVRPGGVADWYFFRYETADFGLKLDFQPFNVIAPAETTSVADERRQLRDLRKAACALYLEGKWVIDEETDAADLEAQAKLWADLRDALGFKPGFNTTVSVKA